MKRFLFLMAMAVLPLFILSFNRVDKAFTGTADSLKVQNIDALIENLLLKPLKEKQAKVDVKMFSRAYIGETYKYDIYEKPSKKHNYYQCTLLEYRNQFIVKKIEFRVFEKAQKIEVEDSKTRKYIPVADWIKVYKESKD